MHEQIVLLNQCILFSLLYAMNMDMINIDPIVPNMSIYFKFKMQKY